jgi:hypothetical protein
MPNVLCPYHDHVIVSSSASSGPSAFALSLYAFFARFIDFHVVQHDILRLLLAQVRLVLALGPVHVRFHVFASLSATSAGSFVLFLIKSVAE